MSQREISLFLFQSVVELYVLDLKKHKHLYLLNFKTLIIHLKFVFRYTVIDVTN